MNGEMTMRLKILIASVAAGLVILALATVFGAMEIASRLGLPPILGAVAGLVLLSFALPRLAMALFVSLGARLLVRALLSPKSLQARLAKIDRTLVRERRRPHGDAAVAETLAEKVRVLTLLDRRPEAELVREEAILLATYSQDPVVQARLDEFEHLLQEKPGRP